jgi:hypothetical protein
MRISTTTLVSILNSTAGGAEEKKNISREKSQKVHSKTFGKVQVRGATGLSPDLQQSYVYACEEGRPIKGETKNCSIAPNYEGDDRGDKNGDYNFGQTCFLGSRGLGAMTNYRTREAFGVDSLEV